MAKVVKERPRAFVIPASGDDEDLSAARAGEAIYEHSYRTLNVKRIMRRASFWTITTGTAFIKDWWDNSVKDGENVGKMQVECVTPFHLLVPDLTEEELEYQPYIIHEMSKSPEWIKEKFNHDIQPNSFSSGDMLEQKFLSAVGVQEHGKEYVSVREIWIKPCGKFPRGAHILWAGDTILSKTEGWVFQHGEYPFTKINHIPTGRFYGDSVIIDLIPIQKEFNRTRSQLIESKNRMAKPQLVAARGSIDPNKVTSEPGLVIFYTPGFNPPQPLPLTAIPNYVPQELDRCLADMDDISSQHEVSRGQTPPGVTAATAISYLTEQDETKLAFTIESIEEAHEKLGRHFLHHAQQFWNSGRAVRVVGENGSFDVEVFRGSDLRGNADLKIEAGSAMPQSRAAKQAFITEIGKMGWITPDKALKYLDMAETNRMFEELSIDIRQQERENLRLMRGEEVPVNDWDNDEVHLATLDNFRKKQQFEHLPDNVKEFFHQHAMLHQQRLAIRQGTPILPGEPVPPPPGDGSSGPPPPPGGGGGPGGMQMPPLPPSGPMEPPPQGPA